VKGALREVRRADEIGAENIERMSLESSAGELDIQRKSGKIVESKSTFGYTDQEVEREFNNKLSSMREDSRVSLDGNTLEIRATNVGDERLVRSNIQEWEERVASNSEWNNADVNIKVIDESTGTEIEN